jgi:hypothetical protein
MYLFHQINQQQQQPKQKIKIGINILFCIFYLLSFRVSAAVDKMIKGLEKMIDDEELSFDDRFKCALNQTFFFILVKNLIRCLFVYF